MLMCWNKRWWRWWTHNVQALSVPVYWRQQRNSNLYVNPCAAISQLRPTSIEVCLAFKNWLFCFTVGLITAVLINVMNEYESNDWKSGCRCIENCTDAADTPCYSFPGSFTSDAVRCVALRYRAATHGNATQRNATQYYTPSLPGEAK